MYVNQVTKLYVDIFKTTINFLQVLKEYFHDFNMSCSKTSTEKYIWHEHLRTNVKIEKQNTMKK